MEGGGRAGRIYQGEKSRGGNRGCRGGDGKGIVERGASICRRRGGEAAFPLGNGGFRALPSRKRRGRSFGRSWPILCGFAQVRIRSEYCRLPATICTWSGRPSSRSLIATVYLRTLRPIILSPLSRSMNGSWLRSVDFRTSLRSVVPAALGGHANWSFPVRLVSPPIQ
jgi:hypothetical protein